MDERSLLALFHEVTPAADAIARLRDMGIPDEDVAVMSGRPYQPQILGRPRIRGKMGRIALVGAILGVLTAVFLTAGIFLLYPLIQGGQPLVPIPPSLIITFEVTMLGTMWASFLGFVVVNRFPVFGRPVYDARITADSIGVLAQVSGSLVSQAENAFRESGAHDVQRLERERINTGAWLRLVATAGLVVAVLASVSLLFFYDILRIPFPSQMVHQDSIGYEQGPRLAVPAEAIPVQGPVLIAGQPASEPVPATADSLQRGQVLFDINCALCHGKDGAGTGPLSGFFSPKPADLTGDEVQNLPNAEIFLTITQGRGVMPSLAENLSPIERWDLVNYVRSLKK
jgi:mono/diheme cytochrome c family protein